MNESEVKRILDKNGIKYKWLADKLLVHTSTVSVWLNSRGIPRYHQYKIEEILKPFQDMENRSAIEKASINNRKNND